MMTRQNTLKAGPCTVVVRLNRTCDLHIRTSAAHALEVVGGKTIFAKDTVEVFDLDGKRMTTEQLTRLHDDEHKA